MNKRILILHGDNEHVCLKEDDGTCSLACPCFCSYEGFTYKEAVVLKRPLDLTNFKCSLEG